MRLLIQKQHTRPRQFELNLNLSHWTFGQCHLGVLFFSSFYEINSQPTEKFRLVKGCKISLKPWLFSSSTGRKNEIPHFKSSQLWPFYNWWPCVRVRQSFVLTKKQDIFQFVAVFAISMFPLENFGQIQHGSKKISWSCALCAWEKLQYTRLASFLVHISTIIGLSQLFLTFSKVHWYV